MIPNSLKRNYAVGAIPNGIKTDAFTFFLLFFYSNVVGLNPALAGTAILIALCIDAVTDPLMGTISDRTNTRLGRRHPYMFVSFIPMAIGYILLFAPRQDWDLSQSSLFIWMLSFTVLTRIGMTLFDIPHRSFGAEVTKNYQDRAVLMTWREMMQWVSSLGNAALAYFVFFKPTSQFPQGLENPDAWLPFALTGGIVMIVSVLFTSFKTKPYINSLSEWKGSSNLKDIVSELKIALTNKSFAILFFGNLTLSISWGLTNSLALYVNTQFWELSAAMIGSFLPIYFISTMLAFYITPRLIGLYDKRTIVMVSILGVSLLTPVAFILFNLGLTPEKGTFSLVLFIGSFLVFLVMFAVIGNMTRDSMVGDIADEVQLQSSARQEGILYSAVSFMQKLNSGFGSFFAGMVLSFLEYPYGDNAGIPSAEQTYSLAFVQGPVGAVLLLIPFFIFYKYGLTKQRHEEIIKSLEQQ
jgi:GPH family glycoside/pentoside/hexuronide:cation symporter